MRFPLVLLWDRDRELGDWLRRTQPAPPWVTRHVHDVEECQRLLRTGFPTVIVARSTGRMAEGLELLDWLQAHAWELRVILLMDSPDEEIEALAWNLGAFPVPRKEWPRLPGMLRAFLRCRS
jgi:DNA-binding response OmpR family regulator